MGENQKVPNRIGHLGLSTRIAIGVGIGVLVLSYLGSRMNNFPGLPSVNLQNPDMETPLSEIIETPSSISTIGPSPTISITPPLTPTYTSSPSFTPSPFPSAFQGTIGPLGFFVGPWHDNYVVCEKYPRKYFVQIYGVEVDGGNPPYQFDFWQLGTTSRVITSENNIIEFEEPIQFKKGSYIHVTITFTSTDGKKLIWIDDLYYPIKDSSC